jgi:hypothetical protein
MKTFLLTLLLFFSLSPILPDSRTRMEEKLNLLHELETRKIIQQEIEKVKQDDTDFRIYALFFLGFFALMITAFGYYYTYFPPKERKDEKITYHIENAYFSGKHSFLPEEKDVTPKRRLLK